MWGTVLRSLLAATALIAFDAGAAELKLASWNLGNLASGPGVALRGHERNAAEYQHIRDIVGKLSPDIIALQEMGSIASAKAILGEGYTVVFEKRCLENSARCESDVEDIFTAIAFRNGAGEFTEVQLPELSILHTSECANETPRPVRGGVGLEFQNGGEKIVILSVHLKASCKRNDNEGEGDQADDCATLMKQADILADWIKTQRQAGKKVIVAGDFNRQLLDPGDHVAAKLKAVAPDAKFVPTARECWASFPNRGGAIIAAANQKFPEIAASGGSPLPYSPRSNAKIDYFVVSGPALQSDIVAEQYPMGGEAKTSEFATDYLKTCEGKPNKFEDGKVLTFSEVEPSDHCPISMTLK
ncbi:endonuclease/exonuclease/phosphatase family protein [Rhizobium sp. RAF36]|uniref:endonuclease/exonuclease/phosphatase family protein n=1 Tax=Rhizobium sp. RAF36 TaxID=3233055 RepID=UPI003F98CA0D